MSVTSPDFTKVLPLSYPLPSALVRSPADQPTDKGRGLSRCIISKKYAIKTYVSVIKKSLAIFGYRVGFMRFAIMPGNNGKGVERYSTNLYIIVFCLFPVYIILSDPLVIVLFPYYQYTVFMVAPLLAIL